MILRLFAQVLLATSLFQLFPADAGQIQEVARLPEAGPRRSMQIGAILSFLSSSLPESESKEVAPQKIHPLSVGVNIAAVSALVVDAGSGTVLFEKQADEPRSIGSMTKLMTALVFLQSKPDLQARASIQPEDVRVGGQQHVSVGDEVSVQDLILASLVSSDNSATMSLARLSGLSESDFIVRMNEVASELGMTRTTFTDPTGLSPENRSVTGDLVKMLRAALADGTIHSATEHVSASIQGVSKRIYPLENTDELMKTFLNEAPYHMVGGKTGYLPEAGYCLGVQIQKEGSGDLFIIVLGSDSKEGRVQDVKKLAVWA